jgi:hypothetical protein
VLNASVLGVYGCAGVAFCGTDFISHTLSEWSDVGDPFVACMSSISILSAARIAAVGIKDQMPRRRLKKNTALQSTNVRYGIFPEVGRTYAMKTVTANAPFAIWQ